MNWLPQWRRLAIYLRDGLQCCWCGLTLEDGIKLTLDHATPRAAGGSNASSNLFTCCLTCNAKRRDSDLVSFALQMSHEWFCNEVMPENILSHIVEQLHKPIDAAHTKALLRERGNFSTTLKSLA